MRLSEDQSIANFTKAAHAEPEDEDSEEEQSDSEEPHTDFADGAEHSAEELSGEEAASGDSTEE